MDKDRLKGSARQAKGAVKEAAGRTSIGCRGRFLQHEIDRPAILDILSVRASG